MTGDAFMPDVGRLGGSYELVRAVHHGEQAVRVYRRVGGELDGDGACVFIEGEHTWRVIKSRSPWRFLEALDRGDYNRFLSGVDAWQLAPRSA